MRATIAVVLLAAATAALAAAPGGMYKWVDGSKREICSPRLRKASRQINHRPAWLAALSKSSYKKPVADNCLLLQADAQVLCAFAQ